MRLVVEGRRLSREDVVEGRRLSREDVVKDYARVLKEQRELLGGMERRQTEVEDLRRENQDLAGRLEEERGERERMEEALEGRREADHQLGEARERNRQLVHELEAAKLKSKNLEEHLMFVEDKKHADNVEMEVAREELGYRDAPLLQIDPANCFVPGGWCSE